MSVYPDGVEIRRDAVLSDDGRYRYKLGRTWDPAVTRLTFVMLNPSTADAEFDDPTIRRCVGFARRFGYGGVVVVNLYGYRATKPADLWRTADPVGPENDSYLRDAFAWASNYRIPVVAAWGANAKPSRVSWVRSMQGAGTLHHFGLTKDGHPKHPLARGYHRIPDDQPLMRWEGTDDHHR